MATYAIGDVQGCHDALQRLLDHIRFDPSGDRLWFVGDLVNRGPDSLGVLRYIRSLGSSARIVLGNHDLFLLAASEGVVALRPKDTIDDVLRADDRLDLIDWLRHQPLHHREGPFFMVHAGLLPQWTTLDAARLASEVETALRAGDFRSFLQSLFHEPVITWSPHLTGAPRLVSITRVLTGLRTCTSAGDTSNFSGPPEETPPGYFPWFRIPTRRSVSATVITGHWAALGLHLEPNLLALDSGCVWGRQLTGIRLEDRQVFQVNCLGTLRNA
jgi:bis(5'-nucleosyl)-tetraphosphatase (symmetrical)